MVESTRYQTWYRSRLACKNVSVKFLTTLLILANFPEHSHMAHQHQRHHSFQRMQPHEQSRNIFHPNFTIKAAVPIIGAMRNTAKMKGYHKWLHGSLQHPRTAMAIIPVSQQDQQIATILPAPINYNFHLPPGEVLAQRLIHISPQQKRFIQHKFPVDIPKKPERCPGRKNIIDDISIIGLKIAMITSSVGMYNMIINSMTSNNIDIVSYFLDMILWIPGKIISLFNLDGNYVWLIGRFLDNSSFKNNMFNLMGGLFESVRDVLANAVGQSVGVISFVFAVIATFPDLLDAFVEYLKRVGNKGWLVYLIEHYGCEVPGFLRWNGKSFYQFVNDFLVNLVNSKGPVKIN